MDDEEKHVQELIQELKGSDEYGRWSAARALGAMGEKAVPAVPEIIQALNDPNARVRHYAGGVLCGMGEQALPALIKAAREQPGLRPLIQEILKKIEMKKDLGINEGLLEAPEKNERFKRELAVKRMKDRVSQPEPTQKKVKK